ncbi:unnamed protein product [Merluccius merluccius]
MSAFSHPPPLGPLTSKRSRHPRARRPRLAPRRGRPSEMTDGHGDEDGQLLISDLLKSFSIDSKITERRGVSSHGRYRADYPHVSGDSSVSPGVDDAVKCEHFLRRPPP